MNDDDQNLKFVRDELVGGKGAKLVWATLLLGLGTLLVWKGRGSVKNTADVFWMAGFLVALFVPGLLLLRSGLRSLDKHPLWLALTAHRDWIESADIQYTKYTSGRVTATVWVVLGSHGRGHISFDKPDGKEREIASWILSRKLPKGAA